MPVPDSSVSVPAPVWDLPIRLFHWMLVALVALLWVSGEKGWMNVHLLAGPAVLSLLVFRVIWGLVGSPTARFAQFVRGPAAVLSYVRATLAGHPPLILGHNPLGALSVLALLSLLLVQGISGLFTSDDIATDGPLVAYASGKAVSVLSTVHRLGFKVLLLFIVLHLCAVLFYTLVKKDNLILPMLTGHKKLPAGHTGIVFASGLLALVLFLLSVAAVFGGLSRLG